jgi:hypothetical protein
MEVDEDDSLETMEVYMDDTEDGSDMNDEEGSTPVIGRIGRYGFKRWNRLKDAMETMYMTEVWRYV